jgi:hypothetical protein
MVSMDDGGEVCRVCKCGMLEMARIEAKCTMLEQEQKLVDGMWI